MIPSMEETLHPLEYHVNTANKMGTCYDIGFHGNLMKKIGCEWKKHTVNGRNPAAVQRFIP